MSANESYRSSSCIEPHGENSNAPSAQSTENGRRRSSLGRTISYALKGILSLVILGVFFSLGKQLINLYVHEKHLAPKSILSLSAFDTSAVDPIGIQFGDQPIGFQCLRFQGNRADVILRLKQLCRLATQQSAVPSDLPSIDEERVIRSIFGQNNSTVTAREETIVRSIAGMHATPAVIGIRKISSPAKQKDSREHAEMRVVAWGFATQKSSNEWSLQIITKDAAANNETEPSLITLPPGSQKIMQMNMRKGNSVIAFESQDPIATQMAFFDRYYTDKRWVRDGEWRDTNRGFATVYRNSETSTEYALNIHLTSEPPKQSSQSETVQGIISLDTKN